MERILRKQAGLARKRQRIRKTILGEPERPRLSVFRSEKHIYGQIIDDLAGKSLVACSSCARDLRSTLAELRPVDIARRVGEALAERAVAKGITKVVFDRGGRKYAGRVAALAEGARSKGLQF